MGVQVKKECRNNCNIIPRKPAKVKTMSMTAYIKLSEYGSYLGLSAIPCKGWTKGVFTYRVDGKKGKTGGELAKILKGEA